MFSPLVCGSFSILITSPGATRYCFPPARITAYMAMPPMNFSGQGDHLAADERLRWLAEFPLGAADGQHFVKLNVFAAGLRQLLDLDYVAVCDAIKIEKL